jgi:hypothetical protein
MKIKKMLDRLVKAMDGVPRINKMCPEVGVSYEDLKHMVRVTAANEGIDAQRLLNFLLLGASIGYLYGKGQTIALEGEVKHE